MISFLKNSAMYSDYLRQFYSDRPGLELKTYSAQYAALMADCFGWADFWKRNLDAPGQVNVYEIVHNCEPLQKAWAHENNMKFAQQSWMIEILEAQLRVIRPEIWFCHGYEIGPDTRVRWRSTMPWLRYVVGWDGLMKNDASFFSGCDHILACHPESVAYYRRHGFASHFFQFGFERSILDKIERRDPTSNITFIGSISTFEKGHNARLALLGRIAKKHSISIWLSGPIGGRQVFRAAMGHAKRGSVGYGIKLLRQIGNATQLGRLNQGSLYGLTMFQTLADSAIGLNSHIDAAGTLAGNIRMFEVTGLGSCLLTDWKSNLDRIFELDREVVAYRSSDECLDKILFLLRNDRERNEIAVAGQKRTLSHYSLADSITEAFASISAVA